MNNYFKKLVMKYEEKRNLSNSRNHSNISRKYKITLCAKTNVLTNVAFNNKVIKKYGKISLKDYVASFIKEKNKL